MINLSSGNHLVDGHTDIQTYGHTDGRTDMSKTIYPLFFEGGHIKISKQNKNSEEQLFQKRNNNIKSMHTAVSQCTQRSLSALTSRSLSALTS
ncbi:hypothetical protein DPMN_131304, partial [Dreissena polymorpha]